MMGFLRWFLSVYLTLIILEIRWDGISFHERIVSSLPTSKLVQWCNQGFAAMASNAKRLSNIWFYKTHLKSPIEKAQR